MYIDSHAHLFMLIKQKGLSLKEIFEEMNNNGVNTLLNVSGERVESDFHIRDVVKTAREFGIKIFHSAGIHPHVASSFCDETNLWLKEIAPFIDAIGEVGLDFHYNFSPRETQITVLRKMAELSLELSKPLIIHGRNGEAEIISMLEKMGLKGKKVLFHCYTGDKNNAAQIMENGWSISFSGILTFKKISEMTDVIKICDKNRIMFETDSPFLAPHPFRGKINTPAKVKYVYEFAADLLDIELNMLSLIIKNNFDSFLGCNDNC